MTQEEQIIEYLELNGPQTGRDISQALGIKSIPTRLKRAIARGEVVTTITLRTGCRRDMNLYAVANEAELKHSRVTVKAVQGMAPKIAPGFAFSDPFQLGRRNAT